MRTITFNYCSCIVVADLVVDNQYPSILSSLATAVSSIPNPETVPSKSIVQAWTALENGYNVKNL